MNDKIGRRKVVFTMKMKRNYTREFKVQACKLVLGEGIKSAVVAERFEINTVMLYR